jgi:hypothetical protein
MKLQATIIALLFSALLYGQAYETVRTSEEGAATAKRKSRIINQEFDRVDYLYKDNLLQYALQYNGGGGYPRTWRYFYDQERSNAVVNMMKEKYPNKILFGAVQVAFRNTQVYEVIMQDKKRWYVYQVDTAGLVNLKRQFKKR